MFKEVINNRRGVGCPNCASIATTSDHLATTKASGLVGTGIVLTLFMVTAIVGMPMLVYGFIKSTIVTLTPSRVKINQPHVHKCKTCKHKWETATLHAVQA